MLSHSFPGPDDAPDARVIQLRPEAVSVPFEPDHEVAVTDPGEYGGPVDPPAESRTLYGTVTGFRDADRPPVVPAWILSSSGRSAMVRATARHAGYVTAFHAARSPRYALRALRWAPVGLVRLAGRQLRWAWLSEQTPLRQHAVKSGDAAAWQTLHREARRTRRWRGLVLAGELVAVAVGGVALVLAAPLAVQILAGAVAVPVLARLGRPVDRPLTDRTVTGPRFTRLTGEMVRTALCSIGLSGIKDPGSVTFPPPGIHRDGPGWLARVNLPAGVEAVDVMERRGKLSSALRLPVDQVWPSAGPEHAGQVDVWVGYLPASKMGQPRWSLLADSAVTSVFDSNEFGTDERQRPVKSALFARNFLVGGVPGSGKSYAARTLAMIAALDPTCELKIAEFKGTGDFGDLADLCTTYVCGVDDAAFRTGLDVLTWGLAEAERRGERVRKAKERGEAPEGKVTPELAAKKGSGLHPVFILIDEAHELFGDSEVGKAAAVAAERLIKRGRALGIMVVLATQIPDRTSLPPNIVRCVTVRWCLAVQDQVANDMILGTGSYKRGMTATVYRPGVDAGWGVVTGIETAGPVRSHYPDSDDTARLVARATALRGGVGGERDDVIEARDTLADALSVFVAGEPGLHWETVAARMAERFPNVYGGSTPEMVRASLTPAGVTSRDIKISGTVRKGARRDEIEAAISRRTTATE